MKVAMSLIQELRQRSGAGILDCKRALEETQGNIEKAVEILRRKGLAIAAKKADRIAQEGVIEAYVHPGERMGALVELNCETDFVARTKEFRQLAHDIAMQVVASRPFYVEPEDVPAEMVDKEKENHRAQAREENKPPQVVDSVVEGRLEKYFDEICLLRQPFIKDEDRTVQDIVNSYIARLGENIVVNRFAHFELGERE